MKIKPLPYRLLINALESLGAYIPFEPKEPDSEFIIFSSCGSGYMPKGCGPRCAFITKPDGTLVPSKEIEKLIMVLHFKTEFFLEMVAKLSPDPTVPLGQESFEFPASAAVMVPKKQ